MERWHAISTAWRYVTLLLQRLYAQSRRALRFGRQSEESGWAVTIGRLTGDLEGLNHATERDFLAVGEKLMEFRATARRISSEMAALTDLISGEQGSQTSQVLGRILEHTKVMDVRAQTCGEALARMRELASRIPAAFSDLRNRGMLFRTLCTLTRIETSALGTAGSVFDGLTESIKPLSESIHASGERVLKAASQLESRIQRALASGSDLQARQFAELHALIASVMDGLQAYAQRRRQANDTSVRQAAQHQAVCKAIDDLVQSVQFHDITRQQVEHIIESLRRLRREFPGSGPCVPPGVRPVVNLQYLQLSSATGAFGSSVDRLRLALEDISARVSEIVESSRSLLGLASREEDSFFLHMERCCTEILGAICDCGADSTQIRETAGELEATVGDMRKSVNEIRGIELQIQRISINAAIGAAHIGEKADSGNTLNTIAEAMQRLVRDSSRNTEDAAQVLDAMTEAARTLARDPDGATEVSLDTRDLLRDMRSAVLELHTSSESSCGRVTQVASLGSDLSEEIRRVLDGFHAGELFARVSGRVRSELEQLSGPEAVGISQPALNRFADHYTMQTEREVHQSATKGANSHPHPPVPSTPAEAEEDAVMSVAGGDSDLGDNVELF